MAGIEAAAKHPACLRHYRSGHDEMLFRAQEIRACSVVLLARITGSEEDTRIDNEHVGLVETRGTPCRSSATQGKVIADRLLFLQEFVRHFLASSMDVEWLVDRLIRTTDKGFESPSTIGALQQIADEFSDCDTAHIRAFGKQRGYIVRQTHSHCHGCSVLTAQ